MGTTYSVSCECGRALSVTSAAAGTNVRCRFCGQEVRVPGLSRLRELQGQDAYASNPVDVIAAVHADGREPAGMECLKCGRPAENAVDLKILCERSEMDLNSRKWVLVFFGGGISWTVGMCFVTMSGLRIPRWTSLMWFGGCIVVSVVSIFGVTWSLVRNRKLERESPENLRTHFRLCSKCLPKKRSVPSRKIIRLMLKKHPLFEELYRIYPEAYTKVVGVRDVDPYENC